MTFSENNFHGTGAATLYTTSRNECNISYYLLTMFFRSRLHIFVDSITIFWTFMFCSSLVKFFTYPYFETSLVCIKNLHSAIPSNILKCSAVPFSYFEHIHVDGTALMLQLHSCSWDPSPHPKHIHVLGYLGPHILNASISCGFSAIFWIHLCSVIDSPYFKEIYVRWFLQYILNSFICSVYTFLQGILSTLIFSGSSAIP